MPRVTEELRASEPVVAGVFKVLPIERVQIVADSSDTGYRLTALKHPYAIVYRDASGLRAIDENGNTIPIDALTKEIANLDELI